MSGRETLADYCQRPIDRDTGWRKSSYSASSGGANCVEAGRVPGTVLVRDATEGGRGPVLRVSAETWRAFTTAIRAGAAR